MYMITETPFQKQLAIADMIKRGLFYLAQNAEEDSPFKLKIEVNIDILLDKWCIYTHLIDFEKEKPKVIHSESLYYEVSEISEFDFHETYAEITKKIENAVATNTLFPFSYLRDPNFKKALMEKLS